MICVTTTKLAQFPARYLDFARWLTSAEEQTVQQFLELVHAKRVIGWQVRKENAAVGLAVNWDGLRD